MIIPPLYRYSAIATLSVAALVTAYGAGHRNGSKGVQDRWDAQIAEDVKNAAEHRVEVETNNVKEVTRYVDVYKTVEVSVPRVVTKLVRFCPASDPGQRVPSSGDIVTTAPTDPGAGRLDDLGADLIAARGNLEQCRALIQVVQQQTPR